MLEKLNQESDSKYGYMKYSTSSLDYTTTSSSNEQLLRTPVPDSIYLSMCAGDKAIWIQVGTTCDITRKYYHLIGFYDSVE